MANGVVVEGSSDTLQQASEAGHISQRVAEFIRHDSNTRHCSRHGTFQVLRLDVVVHHALFPTAFRREQDGDVFVPIEARTGKI